MTVDALTASHRWTSWRTWIGAAVTALMLGLVELAKNGPWPLAEPLPAGGLLVSLGGLVLAAFWGGYRGASLAVVVYTLYAPRFVAPPGTFVDLSPAGMTSTVILCVIASAVAFPTAYLKRRLAAAASHAVEAERREREAVTARNRELATANQILTDFTHVVSHDLKEPVRALAVLHRALEEDDGARLSPGGQEMLGRLKDADVRLAAMVEALLEYSRATRVNVADLRPVSLASVLRSDEFTARYATLAAERRAVVDLATEDAVVLGARTALSIILGNLVANAIKHNPSATPRVRVRARPLPPEKVEILVEDNGPGFSPESLERIRAVIDGRQHAAGVGRSGFGILIVQRAVERLGGELHLGSPGGTGAAIRVVLHAPRPEPARAEGGGGRRHEGVAPQDAPSHVPGPRVPNRGDARHGGHAA